MTWKAESPDGEFVLVMISPLSEDEELEILAPYESWNERRKEIAAIRAIYTESGLYRNDGSITPLWTMEFQSDNLDAHVAPNGQHVVVYSTEWRHTGWFVIAFYDRGNELESYDIEELWATMPSMKWKHLVRTSRSPDAAATFDADAMTCELRTEAGERFVFDVRTGRIVSQWSPWPLYLASAIGFPVLAGSGLALTIVWSRSRARRRRAAVL